MLLGIVYTARLLNDIFTTRIDHLQLMTETYGLGLSLSLRYCNTSFGMYQIGPREC